MPGRMTLFLIGFMPLVAVAMALAFSRRTHDTPAPPAAIRNAPEPQPRSDEVRPPAPAVVRTDAAAGDVQTSDKESGATPSIQTPRPSVAVRRSENRAAKALEVYASGLMIEASEVNKPETAARLRILDVRAFEKYRQRHIPGAVYLDLNDWVNAFSAAQSSSVWEKRIAKLGINLDTPVVICDEGWGKDAACIWAILRYWGIRDVRVLNGGWPAWLFEGAYQDDTETLVPPRVVKLEPNSERAISKSELLELTKTRGAQIVDAFFSEKSDSEPQVRSDHRLSASVKSLAWTDVIDWRKSTFKPAPELCRICRSAGIDPTQPIVVYGKTLMEAATLSLMLESVAARNVRIYFPGWDS